MKKKLYIATLVLVMILGVLVTASNAQEIPNESISEDDTKVISENIIEENDIDTDIETDEGTYKEDDEISAEDEDMYEIYLGENGVYVYTAIYDDYADTWFLYETCKHCELASYTETTPEEIYDRFNVKLE